MRDANGQALAFVYCEDEPGRRATGKLLTRDEARRIAANIARLLEFLRRLGCARVNHQLELSRLFDRQIGWLDPFQEYDRHSRPSAAAPQVRSAHS